MECTIENEFAKQEELSEMQIRRELGERKLSAAASAAELRAEQLQRKLDDAHNQLKSEIYCPVLMDKLSAAASAAELRAEQLQRKLDDAHNQLKRKEKEFEETMDHLQQDIESLESERGALRDKLKLYAKRGGTHHAAVTPPASLREFAQEAPVKVAPGYAADEVNEALQRQIKVLNWTIERERAARVAACKRAERSTVRALRPLYNPDSAAAVARRQAVHNLERRLQQLQSEWTLSIARSGLIKLPEKMVDYPKVVQQHKEKQREIRRQLEVC
ncbi:Dynactin subunit 1 [Papilio machaon]|uniref:Dynactin subunit 1 n=1 Tax=Papilio machaon TaxID=76193 RepID=A0A0N0PF73_PAPMA|nr:Dynactin subunit 1 [Papilio machaon]